MDPDIAPLARRLAEENNVEWRGLQGSGTGGRIVERDVLDFLARVMAGEEDVNPTPEPLPEGVEAWTDDVGRPLGAAASAGRTAADEGQERGSSDDAVVDEDDLLLAGDDLLQESDTTDSDDAAEEDLLLAGGTETDRGASRYDDGDRDAGDHDAGALPDLFDERAPRSGRSDGAPDLFIDDDEAEPDGRDGETFDFGGLPGADVRHPTDQDATMDTESESSDSYSVGDDADALSFGDDESGGMSGSGKSGGGENAARADVDEPFLDGIEMDEAEGAQATPSASDGAGWRAPVASEAASDATGSDEARRVDAVPTADSASTDPGVADVQRWPLARTRTVVRRNVDVGDLLAVRRSVALEAGMDDIAAVAVLYAAATRAADMLGLERPGIALPDGSGGVFAIVPDSDDGLAEMGRAVDRAVRGSQGHEGADADLWVVDLAGVGVDEAILDTDVAQLVLGRVLSDDSDGSARATMSLVADVPVEQSAAFLARVADLLEDPLRLLA